MSDQNNNRGNNNNSGGGNNAPKGPPKPKRFAGLAQFSLFLTFMWEVALTAMTLWFFLRPYDPEGQLRDGFPSWWVNNYGWLWGSALASLALQLVMLVVPLFIPPYSQFSMWRNIISFFDTFTNYFGFIVLLVYVMGFSPSLKVMFEYIFASLTAGDCLMLIIIAAFAEGTKQVSHMMMSEDKLHKSGGK